MAREKRVIFTFHDDKNRLTSRWEPISIPSNSAFSREPNGSHVKMSLLGS